MRPFARAAWRACRRPAAIVAVLALAALVWPNSTAAGDDEDENPYRPGIVAVYRGVGGAEHSALEDEIAFDWGEGPPDRRLSAGPFAVTFTGRLLVQTPGTYRLHVFAAGAVHVDVAGNVLIDGKSPEPAWIDGKPIELEFGYHPIAVRYRHINEPARLALFWQGPQFELEPLAARWLYHESANTPSHTFADGRRLVRALRCAACHDIAAEPECMPAPALDRLAGNISRDWLIDWLIDPHDKKLPSRKMPHLGLDRAGASSIADYLLAVSEKTPPPSEPRAPAPSELPATKKKKNQPAEQDKPHVPSVAGGERLFRTLGCLACHRAGELGSDDLFGGGDLSSIANKRPAEFFARWLSEPEALNRDHRMPVFTTSAAELTDLSTYLQSLEAQPATPQASAGATADDKAAKRLIHEFRCAACHKLPSPAQADAARKRSEIDLSALDKRDRSCLFEPGDNQRPGYRLDGLCRQAITAYLTSARPASDTAHLDGTSIIEEHNCLSCHARATSRGLAAQLPSIIEVDPSLREAMPSLAPPSLVGIGDKLRDESLRAAIDRSQSSRYAWLGVRMPRFPLSKDEAAAVARHFIQSDRIPPRADAPPEASDEPINSTIEAAGARLVTADGFGCTSCHAIGKWKPEKVAPGAEGVDLSQLGGHVRRAWFNRWMHDPARIVPQMEMPAVRQPIRGVLDGDLARQLGAVWHVLDRPGFTPPAPGALRAVRRSNLRDSRERAAVLTEVIELGDRPIVKPLVIGLSNRHNILFDLATARLAAWWIGDTARQQTRGKSWHWEAGAGQLLPFGKSPSAPCDIQVTRGDVVSGVLIGQYITEVDWWEHVPDGIRFEYRLHFPPATGLPPVRVMQEFTVPNREQMNKQSGFARKIEIANLPVDADVKIQTLPAGASIDDKRRSATLQTAGARIEVVLRSDGASFQSDASVIPSKPSGASFRCELAYQTDAKVDQFLPPPTIDRSVTRAELAVVPGFDAVRLPVTDQAMPTGLAWRGDGTLVVSSLEGRVWLARDTDGDGLEDVMKPFSDELAAPYGVAGSGDTVDVINKSGLLRLLDNDKDGQADRTELLASGWGHTRDYHDWAIGLPRDASGNYYVSLPCQQDERTEVAATLRGTIIKLLPRRPTDDDPRRFSVERLCGGLRFANGLALSPAGDLFATDNQGNYTPFNELNYIVKGARYGFINRLENVPGFNPPFEPAAIEIPHPWTRSVNGICFLQTPKDDDRRGGRKLFGPFEGHMVGCEYDTRRLVRLSLDPVGDGFQGAVYPLSREPVGNEETFEGPLVCQVSPRGDLYIGNIRDSGWGAGSNTGSLVRLRPREELPCGIAEVRAAPEGFTIDFTQPVDPQRGADAASYSISSYRRIPTPAYGGPDQDRRVDRVKNVRLDADHRRATIEIGELREGFVYEFHLANLAPTATFFPAEGHYTLRKKSPSPATDH
jgi:mono/diheme cytochrome c family protein